MNRKPLGRGLSALISTAPSPQDNEELREIEIDLITPGEQQPRTLSTKPNSRSSATIAVSGIIQPLLVGGRGGRFELVAGKSEASCSNCRPQRVPAIVREIPMRTPGIALIENIQRQELNPIEEANAYKS